MSQILSVSRSQVSIRQLASTIPNHRPNQQQKGLYRIQIFWKGDPGVVDNFIIRYSNEDTMRNWYKDIDTQRAIQSERRTLRHTGTSDSEFTYMEGMAHMPNPYQQEYDADDNTKDPYYSEFTMSRNASSTSLRTRSATGGSSNSVPHANGRPRYGANDPTLSVHTQFPASGSMSPSDRNANSYFFPYGNPVYTLQFPVRVFVWTPEYELDYSINGLE
jgi:cell division control protein 24